MGIWLLLKLMVIWEYSNKLLNHNKNYNPWIWNFRFTGYLGDHTAMWNTVRIIKQFLPEVIKPEIGIYSDRFVFRFFFGNNFTITDIDFSYKKNNASQILYQYRYHDNLSCLMLDNANQNLKIIAVRRKIFNSSKPLFNCALHNISPLTGNVIKLR